MNNLIWIKIETLRYYNLLLKLNNIGIDIYDIKKNKEYVLLKINFEDYSKIKKYLISYKSSIYSFTGKEKIKKFLKKYKIFTIAIFFSMFILLVANNTIFKVEIKTNNENIKKILSSELDKYNLTTMRLKKSHDKVEKIVTKILEDNKETIKWLEIKYDGLIMIVNVTEVITEENTEKYDNCNIIASKDAKIVSTNIYRGVQLKEINDYVNKGDIILSGSIVHNEEVKNTVCASGKIYGEVWYKVKVEYPFQENIREYTGKNRYNLSIKINDDSYKIFKGRLKIYEEELKNLYKLNDFEINLVKEKEYVEKTNKLTEEEAYNKAISKVEEKIKLMLDEDEKILLKKVLKKEVNDSKIYLEVFIVTKENIGELQIIEEDNINDYRINP